MVKCEFRCAGSRSSMSDFPALSTCNYMSLFLMERRLIAQLQKVEARIFSLDVRKTETARKTLVDVWTSIDPNPFRTNKDRNSL